jgi:hypothetical protein
MRNPFRKQLFVYSQEEIANHLGIIAELNKQRDKLMQQIALTQSDVKQSKFVDTLNMVDDNIQSAQMSLEHMLKRNEKKAREV